MVVSCSEPAWRWVGCLGRGCSAAGSSACGGAALHVEEQLCEGLLACLVCRVLPFSCVNSGLCTNHKSKPELAVPLSVTVRRALMKDFHLETFLIVMSRTCNQALLFSSY